MYALTLVFVSYLTVVQSEINLQSARYLKTRVDRGEPTDVLFQRYKTIFEKSYKDEKEELKRKDIFKENVKYIRRHNLLYAKGEKSFTLAVNSFADLSHKEFLDMYTSRVPLRPPLNITTLRKTTDNPLPTTIDWRSQDYVTSVKDQGKCGACWAFSTTGAVEGQLKKKTGQLTSLSEQQLVDCDKFNFGCQNGFVESAFFYIDATGGLERETDYPYEAKKTECHYDTRKLVPGSKVIAYSDILPGSETDLQWAVATVGPISAGIDSSHKSFQFYQNGVYNETSCSQVILTHAVLVVGYGANPDAYWLVKNSYGKSWGESGYIRMARNRNNQCGIATQAMYPIL